MDPRWMRNTSRLAVSIVAGMLNSRCGGLAWIDRIDERGKFIYRCVNSRLGLEFYVGCHGNGQ